jgi:hypothetical protein
MDHKYFAAAMLMAAAQTSTTQPVASEPCAHERTEFRFTADLPYASAAPLFGAWGERQWAQDWKPQFLYPQPPEDREGAVFRLDRGPSGSAIWITPQFDLAAGRIQHVYILDRTMIVRIDIHLARNGESKTDVAVAYEWTALDPAANSHVRSLAGHGAATAKEWRDAINAYAKSAR